MKYIYIILLIAISIYGCKEEAPKDYVTFSGTIENNTSDSISINNRTFKKSFAVTEKGTFSDTLKIEAGVYYFYNGTESTPVFLKNGYEIDMNIDAEDFEKSIEYSGKGAENSNYLIKKMNFEKELYDQDFNALDLIELEVKISEMTKQTIDFIDGEQGIDSLLVSGNKQELGMMMKSFKNYYGEMISLRLAMPKGSPSPTFVNFENAKGGTTSLSDLKGKNVYIDIWATWCGPCKAEIPSLKKLEEDYAGKNIAFLSISIDDARSHQGSLIRANEKWKGMVQDMNLGGIQIFAPNGWQTTFIKDYSIKGIPRFILLDKEGNIVDPSAPRPSDEKIRTMLDELI